MFSRCKFDERQLKIRGDIYQHAFVLIVVLTVLNAFLLDSGIVWAEGMWQSMMIVIFTIAVCSIEMIVREVYVSSGTPVAFMPYALGILSAVLLIWSFINIAQGTAIISQGHLTKDGVYLVMDLCIFSIFGTFFVKKLLGKRQTEEE